MKKYSHLFSGQHILYDKYNSPKTVFSVPDELQSDALVTPLVKTPQSHLKCENGVLMWDDTMVQNSGSIESLSTNLDTLESQISSIVPGEDVRMQLGIGPKDSTNIVSSSLVTHSFPGDHTQFITNLSAAGPNSDLSLFTPIYTGIAFVNFRVLTTTGPPLDTSDWYFGSARYTINAITSSAGAGVFATPLYVGQTYSIQSQMTPSDNQQVRILSMVYIFDTN
jgi:hypothetical protein